MQKTNTKEKGFEELVERELSSLHGYQVRVASSYDKLLCMDTELVLSFVQNTQSEKWGKVVEQYGNDAPAEFLKRLDNEIEKRGVLSVFREGITDRGVSFKLAFWKPQNTLNAEAGEEYSANILSVMRQVKYSVKNENSIDMVLFLNGLSLVCRGI